MKTIFISDLHLSENNPNLLQLLANFLQQQLQSTAALYILGDLFNVWIGHDNSQFHHEVQQLIIAASKKIPVYFISGNRDFLLRQTEANQLGMQLLSAPCVIDLYGKKTLLLHGDELCINDKLHQIYRSIVHTRLFQNLFLALPLTFRKKIAKRMRQRSYERMQNLPENYLLPNDTAMQKYLNQYHVSQMIFGHFHQPTLLCDFNNDFRYFILSDWHDRAHALVCSAEGQRLVYF